MKTIAVFFGGKSVEHDISVITAMQAMRCLKNFRVVPVYIKPDGSFVTGSNLAQPQTYLNFGKNAKNVKNVTFEMGKGVLCIMGKNKIKSSVKIDCALLCNHGHGGEDGSLQGLLEMAGLPYTSCGVLSSAICMDKVLSKIIMKNAHIPTPAYVQFDISAYRANRVECSKMCKDKLGLPFIVKPANLGSSVGISICENVDMLDKCVSEAANFDDKIIVEKYIQNAREFCCAVVKVGDRLVTSNVQEVKKGKIYSFEDKYIKERPRDTSKISAALDKKIKQLAEKCYRALMCDGVVRIDFLYDEKRDKLYVNEPNSIPGSLAFNLFPLPFEDLLSTLTSQAISRHDKKKRVQYAFSSSAIESYITMRDHEKYKLS